MLEQCWLYWAHLLFGWQNVVHHLFFSLLFFTALCWYSWKWHEFKQRSSFKCLYTPPSLLLQRFIKSLVLYFSIFMSKKISSTAPIHWYTQIYRNALIFFSLYINTTTHWRRQKHNICAFYCPVLNIETHSCVFGCADSCYTVDSDAGFTHLSSLISLVDVFSFLFSAFIRVKKVDSFCKLDCQFSLRQQETNLSSYLKAMRAKGLCFIDESKIPITVINR